MFMSTSETANVCKARNRTWANPPNFGQSPQFPLHSRKCSSRAFNAIIYLPTPPSIEHLQYAKMTRCE